ncbi:T9SS type A sorting domain-containing protein [Deminuibacter soli]|uniref:T9SS C-terminal target domain-containing protein n=1 Tax=Deminuibacter soli TaxID=2291815 RepID=A0A3E1ND26_9BACT|nr:T9SS type A sorting domain-containing protein [Deminuibacter soli]RFM25762.1 T9SS C-terminal target domain-containing protein [Deminuibacter soli]
MQTIKCMLLGLCLALTGPLSYTQTNDSLRNFSLTAVVQDGSLLINVVVNPYYYRNTEYKATVGNRSTYLAIAPFPNQYNGSIALDTFSTGTYTLSVTQRSVFDGHIDTTISTSFYYAKPAPTESLLTPATSLARPVLPLKMNIFQGKPPYTIELAYGTTKQHFTAGAHIDTLISLSQYEGQTVAMHIAYTGSDSIRYTAPTLTVFVQSSPNLYTYQAVAQVITDVGFHKILHGSYGNDQIYDLTTHTNAAIPDSTNLHNLEDYGSPVPLLKKLSPSGLFYNEANLRVAATDPDFPYDAYATSMGTAAWNFSTGQYHTITNSVNSAIAGGNYTAWVDRDYTGCYLNNADSSALYTYPVGVPKALAPDGTLISSQSESNTIDPLLLKYHFSRVQTIGHGIKPVTTGVNDPVWYLRSIPDTFTDSLMRFNADGTNTFVAIISIPFNNDIAFAASKGFAAYQKIEADTSSIWLMKPDNSTVKLAGRGTLQAINNKGDIIYTQNGAFYFAEHTGTQTRWLANQMTPAPPPEGAAPGVSEHIYVQDSLFYFTIANTLLAVQPPANAMLSSFTATNQGTGNLLQWKLGTQDYITTFDVQRSGNSKDFTSIGIVAAQTNAALPVQYNYTDAQPLAGTNYYRLSISGSNGYRLFSDTVSVNIQPPVTRFTAYIWPNPVCTGTMNLVINAAGSGVLRLEIVSLNGSILQNELIPVTKGTIRQQVNVSRLHNGFYFAYLTSGREKFAIPFLKL